MGSQLTLVALAYQTFHLTHSTLMVGLLGFVGLVPLLAGSLWGGSVADAWDRRRVLTLTQFAMAIAVGGLAVNAALAHPEVWVLFVCAAASAGFQGMDWPARRAALPMLVSDDDVTAAVTLQTTTMALSMVVGPALGGVLIARLGLTPVYLIDVATYAVSLTVVLLLPHLVPSGGGTPMGLRSMTEGFRHLKGERLLSATYLIDLNAMIFGMPRAVFPALAVHLYGGGAGVVGLLYAAPGAGALLGSLVTGWTARVRHQGRAIAACVAVWGGTIAVFGVVPVLWIGLALLTVFHNYLSMILFLKALKDLDAIGPLLEHLQFKEALNALFIGVDRVNRYIEDKAPWKLFKTAPKDVGPVMRQVLICLKALTFYLRPFMPDTAQSLWMQLGQPDYIKNRAVEFFRRAPEPRAAQRCAKSFNSSWSFFQASRARPSWPFPAPASRRWRRCR